jgi:hypothetical protein
MSSTTRTPTKSAWLGATTTSSNGSCAVERYSPNVVEVVFVRGPEDSCEGAGASWLHPHLVFDGGGFPRCPLGRASLSTASMMPPSEVRRELLRIYLLRGWVNRLRVLLTYAVHPSSAP